MVVALFVVGGIVMFVLLLGVGTFRSSSSGFQSVQPITITPSAPTMRYPSSSWPTPPSNVVVEFDQRGMSAEQAKAVRKSIEESVRRSR